MSAGTLRSLTLKLSLQVSAYIGHSNRNGNDNLRQRILNLDMHQAQKRPSQRLLGSRAPQSSDNELSWTSFLKLEDDPWLCDQLIFCSKTFPVAGYVAIAGECVRQLSESKLEFFSVKNLSITSALVFDSDDKLELHTKLRQHGLNEENKQWYEIEIASHNAGQSIELCTGLVAREAVLDTEMLQDLTFNEGSHRPVSSDYWYEMIADRGIKYGASQRGLRDISAAFTENKASAKVMPMLDATDSVAHPVFIDHCLQVSMIAACKGQGRLLADLSAITSIQHLVVSNDAWSKLKVNGVVSPGHPQDSTYRFSAVNESGLPILSGQCKITAIPDLEQQSDSKLFSFINWDIDSTYHSLNDLLASFQSDLDSTVALERLALLFALRSEDIGAHSQPYSKRILKILGTRRKGRFGLVPDVSPFVECEPSSRTKLIELLKTQISGTEQSSFGLALERCLTDNTPFSKSDSERQLLLDQLHPLIRNSGTLCELLRLLAHKNPKLKVLELGSGPKDSTNLVLKGLRTQFDEPLYSSYLSASTSLDATTNRKESPRESGDVQSLFFNAEKSIEDQGLKAGTYDLIIITDVRVAKIQKGFR
jgi:hypothetical protein